MFSTPSEPEENATDLLVLDQTIELGKAPPSPGITEDVSPRLYFADGKWFGKGGSTALGPLRAVCLKADLAAATKQWFAYMRDYPEKVCQPSMDAAVSHERVIGEAAYTQLQAEWEKELIKRTTEEVEASSDHYSLFEVALVGASLFGIGFIAGFIVAIAN